MTDNKQGIPLAIDIAKQIKQNIRDELQLTASAGISYNKFLAKIASDFRKPDGLCTIPPAKALEFISRLPIEAFWGVGKATALRMRSLGITNGEELRSRDIGFLTRNFGKMGSVYYNFSRGVDDRPVETEYIRKSVGCEETFREDIDKSNALEHELPQLARRLMQRLERSGFNGNTLTLKIKFRDFTQRTRSITVPRILHHYNDVLALAQTLLGNFEINEPSIRLLGLSVSNPLEEDLDHDWEQLWLNLDFEP